MMELKLSVLAVDDDPANLDTLRRVLRKDYNMTFASSGGEAIRLLGERQFDVLLVDFAMPGTNGAEVLRHALRVQEHAVRILLTAHADLAEVRATRSSGISAAIAIKPWDRDDLVKMISNHMRLATMRRSVAAMTTSCKLT